MGKREGADVSSVKLNLTDPCRRAGTTVEGCQAGGLGHLLQYIQYIRNYNVESPKQDSKRFNSQVRRNTLLIWVCTM